jgi:outer membrane cobalamin receptor
MSQEVYAPRRRIALLGATAMLAVMASPMAFAQTVPQTSPPAPGTSTAGAEGVPAAATQQIVVTGTRIANTNASSANPITVVTSKQIAESSSQTIEDVLQKLPAIGSSGLYGTTNNGGVGLSCTDIRNLGISRVLVLVDGHRFVHDSDGVADCVDLNNIPLQMVDQIQVLKDGASSIYGADAVAGVVNIILKKNFVAAPASSASPPARPSTRATSPWVSNISTRRRSARAAATGPTASTLATPAAPAMTSAPAPYPTAASPGSAPAATMPPYRLAATCA